MRTQAALGAEQQRHIDRLLRDFERNGLSLPSQKRDKIKQIQTRMSGTATFGINFRHSARLFARLFKLARRVTRCTVCAF